MRTRGEQLRGDGGPAGGSQMNEGQGHEHLCDVTAACLYGTEIFAMTERQQQRLDIELDVRKQLGTKNSKSNDDRQECRGA